MKVQILNSHIIHLLLLLTALTSSTFTQASERILSFHSDITVYTGGDMKVVETIRVRSEGNKIRRGIYRDFPTRYKDRLGHNIVVDFDVISVERDGVREAWHSETIDNGIRTYMGSSNHYLQPGEYTFRFSYHTNRQLGFFNSHDELYWNVTGNGWEFPIDAVSTVIHLPGSISSNTISAEAYTGSQGSKGQSYESHFDNNGELNFTTTRPLGAFEGLTIVATWPKGHVNEPSSSEKIGWFFKDNSGQLIALAGVAVLLLYYFYAWHHHGRDPEKGTIFPRFKPPEGLSPAAMRYLMKMGFDNKALGAAVINMAVKGYLSIADNGDEYTLLKENTGNLITLSPGEKALANRLFKKSSLIELNNSNHKTINDAITALKALLKGEYHKAYFFTNSGVLVGGFFISLLTLLGSGLMAASEPMAFLFLCLWLSIWSGAVAALWIGRQYFIAVVFSMFELFALFALSELTAIWVVLLVLLLISINAIFYLLMKAPTRRGRKMMDAIEGFRMYLETAEQDRLHALHPPEQTPELFEKYLPYALALDVEQEWSEQFSGVLIKAAIGNENYSPRWYSGSHWRPHDVGGFSSKLGSSLGGAISSSSSAPGSSSGSGGGGSSGGGGGGGGGGGW